MDFKLGAMERWSDPILRPQGVLLRDVSRHQHRVIQQAEITIGGRTDQTQAADDVFKISGDFSSISADSSRSFVLTTISARIFSCFG